MAGPGGDLLEPAGHRRRQHEIGPRHLGHDPSGQPLEPRRILSAYAPSQVVGGNGAAGHPGGGLGGADGLGDLAGAERQVDGQRGRIEGGVVCPELPLPQRQPLTPPEHRCIGEQRALRRPLRIPGGRADEQHRDVRRGQPVHGLRAGLGEHLHRSGHQTGTEEQGLADRQVSQGSCLARRDAAQAGQIEGQRAQ